MIRTAVCAGVVAWALFAPACSAEPSGEPMRGDAAADARACATDADCDDDSFCSGVEGCVSGRCAAGTSPCAAPMTCDEASERCIVAGCTMPDHDGDGVRSVACGGTDCDDDDFSRFSGNSEACDPADVDEDCDPMTFGARDADGDDYLSSACCNVDPEGTRRCGGDCDDETPGVHPSAPEVCDSRDNDCDATIDEGVLLTFYADCDGDGIGAGSPMLTCTPSACAGHPSVTSTGDCDDEQVAAHPGGTEICDGIDNDCDGSTDPSCMCSPGAMRACGTPDGMGGFSSVGACRPGMQTCFAGTWLACMGATMASAETCNRVDDDCDGTIDEMAGMAQYRDADHDAYGAGIPMMACAQLPGYVANDDDCNDANASIHPGAAETCDGVDSDCDGAADAADPEATTWCATRVHAGPNAECSTYVPDFGGTPRTGCDLDCPMIWGDCDGSFTTGCETDLTTPSNCYACRNQCGPPFTAPTCCARTAPVGQPGCGNCI